MNQNRAFSARRDHRYAPGASSGGRRFANSRKRMQEDRNRKGIAKKTQERGTRKMDQENQSRFQRALCFHQRGELEKALELYGQIVARDRQATEAFHMLAVLKHQKKRNNDALKYIDKAIKIRPSKAEYYFTKGNIVGDAGDIEKAIKYYRKAIEINPNHSESHRMLAEKYLVLGDMPSALCEIQAAIQCAPDMPAYHLLSGSIWNSLGNPTEALAAYEIAIEKKPDYAEAYFNIGTIYKALDEQYEAIKWFQSALKINDTYVDALVNLGTTLDDVGRAKDAEFCLKRALRIQPDSAAIHYNLARIFDRQNRFVEAILHYHKAIELDPTLTKAYLNMGNIQQKMGNIPEAMACYRYVTQLDPDHSQARSNMLLSMHYTVPEGPEALFQAHREWWHVHGMPTARGDVQWSHSTDEERPLRIGYVSPDFKTHSVAFFFESILKNCDRIRFDLYGYSDVRKPDSTTERLKAACEHWQDIHALSDAEVVELIQRDGIHILVDLAGHTAHNRMPVFARRAAPVQVTYLGYPNTTGLDTMDYRITDAVSDPPGLTEHLHSETLVRLPRGFLSYTPPEDAPGVSPPPLGRKGFVTFGSFNNRSKVTEEVLDVWSAILRRMPEARLLLKFKGLESELICNPLRESFSRREVDPKRVLLQGAVPGTREHLDLYGQVDIALDPFPYNGTTTTLEALWMGVPVITKEGSFHVARVGTSILARVGLKGLIAASNEEYVECAVQLAGEPEQLSEWRGSLREQLRGSSLMDGAGFTRELENAFIEMWQSWLRKKERFHNESNENQTEMELAHWIQEGEVAFQQGDVLKAKACFLRVIQSQPSHADALNNLGVLAWQNQETNDARRYFKKALEADPNHRESQKNLEDVQRM